MVGWLVSCPREYRFAPRVDGKSIKLQTVSGEADEAAINDVALVDNKVIAWDGASNKRLKDTGVLTTEVQVLSGVTKGQAAASKALVLDATSNIVGIATIGANTLSLADALTVNGASRLKGNVQCDAQVLLKGNTLLEGLITTNHMKLDGTVKIQSRRSSTDYDVITRSGTALWLGNTTDDLVLITPLSNNLSHVKGSTSYVIWDSGNHGPGSTLNADLLDSQQGSYYLDASNMNAGTLPLARQYGRPVTIKRTFSFYNHGTPLSGVSDYHFDIYGQTGKGTKYVSFGSLPGMSKVINTVLYCNISLSGAGGVSPYGYYIYLGNSNGGSEYLNYVTPMTAGLFSETNDSVFNAGITTKSLTYTLNIGSGAPFDWNNFTGGFWTVYMTYLDYNY